MLSVDFMKTNIEKHFTHTFSILLLHETFKQKEERHFFLYFLKYSLLKTWLCPSQHFLPFQLKDYLLNEIPQQTIQLLSTSITSKFYYLFLGKSAKKINYELRAFCCFLPY